MRVHFCLWKIDVKRSNIFLLVRKDLNFFWNFPKPKNKILNLREALKSVPSLDPYLREGFEETLKLFPEFEKKRKIGIKYWTNQSNN